MATAALVAMQIVSGGGPITKDVYKSYYSDGTAGSEDWKKGELLYLDGLYLKRVGTSGTASADSVNTDDTGYGAAFRRFIALSDHDSSVYASTHPKAGQACTESQYVPVQEVYSTTVIRAQIAASSTTAPTIALLKTAMATYEPVSFYKSAADVWGIDVDENEDKGLFVVRKFDSDLFPFEAESGVAGTAGSGRFVEGTLKEALFL